MDDQVRPYAADNSVWECGNCHREWEFIDGEWIVWSGRQTNV